MIPTNACSVASVSGLAGLTVMAYLVLPGAATSEWSPLSLVHP